MTTPLTPVIDRYRKRDLMRFFRDDAAFAIPELYQMLEAEYYFYAIRLKSNSVLQKEVAHLLKRPVERPPKQVRRFYHDFQYQAGEWDKSCRIIAKVEWHPGDLFPRVGFAVTSLTMAPGWVLSFYNRRGTAEQHIREDKQAINWTRLSCRRFRDNDVWLQLHALAYNLGSFLKRAELPEDVADWSLTSLQSRLIKIGARVVRHARKIAFQLAEVTVSRTIFGQILAAIHNLKPPPRAA